MPSNNALWLKAKRGELALGPAPYSAPRENEIVVRNHAVAVNPVDALTQSVGDLVFPWLKYPAIFGTDVAGEVVEVGTAVTRFRAGDRVVGHAAGTDKTRNNPAEGAFQDYPILLEHMATPIPDAMAYENAAVLPLGVSTAACGLFQKDYLALQYPSPSPTPTGKTLLIWGGSTSVGSNAIQLAVAAGYDVVTTSSPKNFDYCRKLGAIQVFDYRSRTVVADVIEAFKGRTCAGALAIGFGSVEACLDIVHACKGDKFVAIATPSVSIDNAPRGAVRALWLVPTLGRLVAAAIVAMVKSRMGQIRSKFIFGSTLVANEVGGLIYRDFLPEALADGRYLAAPDPLVVGHGLGRIEAALERLRKGVSATKVVVSL
ncbi:MAG: zinc-binding alcohol dehydrogenase family protein [Roseiarcus sp.]|jgi:NADPH:quinone reductase-like Zn-dependent oxidoreductase